MRRTPHFAVVTSLLVTATAANAQGRQAIGVKFTLREPMYLQEYTPETVARLEEAFGKSMSAFLNRSFAFAQFEAPVAGQPTLELTLDQRDRSSTAVLKETGIYARLAQTGAPTHEIYWRTFRDMVHSSDARGKPAEFLKELETKLEIDDAGLARLQGLLSSIPIATAAQPWEDDALGMGWILPFKRSDYCMSTATTFRFANTIHSTIDAQKTFFAKAEYDYIATTVPPALKDFRGNVIGHAFGTSDDMELLRKVLPGKVVVNAVFIDDYHRSDDVCGSPAPPSEATISMVSKPTPNP